MPTYITLKDVKKRWGKGQEDIYPVAQFEKLWGDMTALPQMACEYVIVPRVRGQQLKEPAQLDGWLRDGSAEAVTAAVRVSHGIDLRIDRRATRVRPRRGHAGGEDPFAPLSAGSASTAPRPASDSGRIV